MTHKMDNQNELCITPAEYADYLKHRKAGLKAASTRRQHNEWLKHHYAGVKAWNTRVQNESFAVNLVDSIGNLTPGGKNVLLNVLMCGI